MRFGLLIFILIGSNPVFTQAKVVVVNSHLVLDTMPSRKYMIAQIEQSQNEAWEELMKLEDGFYRKTFSCHYGADTSVIKRLYVENYSMQNKFHNQEIEIDANLQRLSNECNEKTLAELQKVIKRVAEREGYELVLDSSVVESLVSDYLDITPLVIREILKAESLTPFSYR